MVPARRPRSSVLRVLSADMNFAGRSARRTHDRLLQELRTSCYWAPVVVVLLEDLVAGARVDGERHGRGHSTPRG